MMTQTLLKNRYKIMRQLGCGGFGDTFLAEDTQMPSGRRCVIKQLKPVANNHQVHQIVQERFQREAAILEELGDGSDQIPRLYAYFSEYGQFYLVQEWIQGQTLSNKLEQEGLLSESSVKEILLSILPVLEYLHSKRMVHRDIKPDNIILRLEDGLPVLIDFGAVKETMVTDNSSKSIVIGTPGFIPIEQSAGRPVYSSDLYSLGLTAIYLLTGKIPEHLDTNLQTGEVMWRQWALSVSPSFAAVLDKAIQPSSRDRYSTAREMLQALQFGTNQISSTMPLPQQTVVSAFPEKGASFPPSTLVSAHPPAVITYQSQAMVSPQIAPSKGLGDWQKAVIMGGVIGACVVVSLFVTRQQSPSTQPLPQASVAQQNSSSVSAAPSPQSSASSVAIGSQPFVQPQVPSNSAPAAVQIPSQTQYSPQPPSISQQDAIGLVNAWLQAKQVMFASPYNRQPATEITTGEQYDKTAGANGTIDWLANNNAYYRYGVQNIDGVDRFAANGNQATIQVRVTEERTLYKNGNIDPNETDFKTRSVRYNLQLVDGRWKIASSQIIN